MASATKASKSEPSVPQKLSIRSRPNLAISSPCTPRTSQTGITAIRMCSTKNILSTRTTSNRTVVTPTTASNSLKSRWRLSKGSKKS